METLTIIIPTYNGEKTIKECIESITNSIKSNYKIIVVDDNSSDNTNKIVKEMISHNKNIKLIKNKTNSGVSYSRNIGLENCNTKYVTFVDCDDYVIGNIYSKPEEFKNYDLIGFNYCEVYDKSTLKSKYNINNGTFSSNEILNMTLTDKLPLSVWSYIFNMDIIKKDKLKFNEKIKIGEDNLFVIEFINHSSNIKLIDQCNYAYTQNNNSTMHNLNDSIFQLNELYKYLSDFSNSECKKNIDSYKYFKSLCNIKSIHAISNTKSNNRYNYIKRIYNVDKLKFTIHNKMFPKYIRFEAFVLLHFGISFHLFLYPFYFKLKKVIRG